MEMNLEAIKKWRKELKIMYEANPTIENLALLREDMVDAQEVNDAAKGFRELLTQLYPDNAHYIYELLQNARDANKEVLDTPNKHNPSVVRFILTNTSVEFEHSGWRLFNVKDIDSITGLGVSTKVDDKTNVGKFGVGFKSVFSITDNPDIISGKYHFTIERLFIPRVSSPVDVHNTRFILPFDNKHKKPEKAVAEIEKELRGLGSETLLFLNEIEKIEYLLPDGETLGYMKRNEENGVTIIKVDIPNEGRDEFRWLRFTKEVAIVDDDGSSVSCNIAIAFKLKIDERREHQGEWVIDTPKNGGKVCIYFPANKEKSGLRFHIHAPFASTVARESVRTVESNNQLIREIAQLVADAMLDIKSKHANMISVEFLGLLPNNDDDLKGSSREDDTTESVSYEPIRDAIINIFQSHPLVPTKSGEFAPAHKLFRDVSENVRISSVIDDSDLAFLTKQEDILWATTNRSNARANKFLDSLEIDEWGSDELTAVFNPDNDDEKNRIEDWISKKPDEWLMRLYALLDDEEIDVDKSLKFVRTTKNSHVRAFEAYFTPPENEDMPDELNFVKITTYDVGKSNKREKIAQSAQSFLDLLGVQRYNERAIANERLKRYRQPTGLTPDRKYFEDICFFVNFMAKNPKGKSLFSNETFLIGERNGKIEWITPTQLYIVPSKFEGEVAELDINPLRVWHGYNEGTLGRNIYADFQTFLESIGVNIVSEEELIRNRARKYLQNNASSSISFEQIIVDTVRFIEFSHFNNQNREVMKSILSTAYFVVGSDNKRYMARNVCVGLLSKFSSILRIATVSDIYHKFAISFNDFEDFLLSMGAINKLKVEEVPANSWYNWYDHKINGLDEFLELINSENDVDAAYLIWDAVCSCTDYYATRIHTPGRRDTHGESMVLKKLKDSKWVPQNFIDSSNEKSPYTFVAPADANKELLPDIFAHNMKEDISYLFSSLEFGKSIKATNQQIKDDMQRREEALDTLGITESELNLLQKLEDTGLSPDEASEAMCKFADEKMKRESSFPTATVSDSIRQRRKNKIAEEYKKSSPVEYETRPTIIRSSRSSIDPRPYLLDLYTNDDDEVFCQICRKRMPFKKRDGEYYFEAVEAFKPTLLSNEHESKFLILCPICSAKYDEFIRYKRNTATSEMIKFHESITDYDENKEPITIPIILGEEKSSVSFVQKHIIDMKAIIEEEGVTAEKDD